MHIAAGATPLREPSYIGQCERRLGRIVSGCAEPVLKVMLVAYEVRNMAYHTSERVVALFAFSWPYQGRGEGREQSQRALTAYW
jgi:hypothetical protein